MATFTILQIRSGADKLTGEIHTTREKFSQGVKTLCGLECSERTYWWHHSTSTKVTCRTCLRRMAPDSQLRRLKAALPHFRFIENVSESMFTDEFRELSPTEDAVFRKLLKSALTIVAGLEDLVKESE